MAAFNRGGGHACEFCCRCLAGGAVGGAAACSASATEEAQLIAAINTYRSQVQLCAGQGSGELPPLTSDTRLALPVGAGGDLQAQLNATAYPMMRVQSINLSGPREAQTALKALSESFCKVLLDPQFVDIGVSRVDRDWRIVLARPLLAGKLGDWQAEGQKLLEAINTARAQPVSAAASRSMPARR